MREFSRLSEDLLASEEGFCSIELVSRDKSPWRFFVLTID